jgi:hypothetical protein
VTATQFIESALSSEPGAPIGRLQEARILVSSALDMLFVGYGKPLTRPHPYVFECFEPLVPGRIPACLAPSPD